MDRVIRDKAGRRVRMITTPVENPDRPGLVEVTYEGPEESVRVWQEANAMLLDGKISNGEFRKIMDRHFRRSPNQQGIRARRRGGR